VSEFAAVAAITAGPLECRMSSSSLTYFMLLCSHRVISKH
jgi:hypothetical protein